jgi:hypothetical protein
MKEKPPQLYLFDKKAGMTKEEQVETLIKAMMKVIDSRPFVDRKKIDLKEDGVDHGLRIDSLRAALDALGVGLHSGFGIDEMSEMYNQAMDLLVKKTRGGVHAKLKNMNKKQLREGAQGDLFKDK